MQHAATIEPQAAQAPGPLPSTWWWRTEWSPRSKLRRMFLGRLTTWLPRLGSAASFATSLALLAGGFEETGAAMCVASLCLLAVSTTVVPSVVAAVVAGVALGAPGLGATAAWTASSITVVLLSHKLAWERRRWRKRAQRRAAALLRESELAVSTQQHLLPRTLPRPPGYEISACTAPARELGGDLYDAFQDEGEVFLAIGDVAGKGVAAALLMPLTMATLRLHARSTDELKLVAARLNQTLFETTEDSRYVSMFLARLDPASHQIRYVNAGHFPPCLLQGAGHTWLEEGGPPLGMLPDATFQEGTVALCAGDTLLMYTDGLIDAERLDSWRNELPGRLRGALRGWLDQAAAICAGAKRGEVLLDDLTIMILRRAVDA